MPKAEVRPTDAIWFYAEHGAALMAGLFFAGRYIVARLKPAIGRAFHINGSEKSGAASTFCLLTALSVTAVSLSRMLFFRGQTRVAKLSVAPHSDGGQKVRATALRFLQKCHPRNGGEQ